MRLAPKLARQPAFFGSADTPSGLSPSPLGDFRCFGLRVFSVEFAPPVSCTTEFPTALGGHWCLDGRACDEVLWLTAISLVGLAGRLRGFFLGSLGTWRPFDWFRWAGSWKMPSLVAVNCKQILPGNL